jgi:hypothetical protein
MVVLWWRLLLKLFFEVLHSHTRTPLFFSLCFHGCLADAACILFFTTRKAHAKKKKKLQRLVSYLFESLFRFWMCAFFQRHSLEGCMMSVYQPGSTSGALVCFHLRSHVAAATVTYRGLLHLLQHKADAQKSCNAIEWSLTRSLSLLSLFFCRRFRSWIEFPALPLIVCCRADPHRAYVEPPSWLSPFFCSLRWLLLGICFLISRRSVIIITVNYVTFKAPLTCLLCFVFNLSFLLSTKALSCFSVQVVWCHSFSFFFLFPPHFPFLLPTPFFSLRRYYHHLSCAVRCSSA